MLQHLITLLTTISVLAPATVSTAATMLRADSAPFGNLDVPGDGSGVSGAVMVTGWALDKQDATLTIELLVDGQVVSSSPTRDDRADVCAVFPAIGHCASARPGVSFRWDTTKVADGPHQLAFRATDREGLTATVGIPTVTVNNAMTVTAINPTRLAPGSKAAITIAGSGFVAGSTVDFGTGVTFSDVKVEPTRITATVAVGSTVTSGPRGVTVTTPDGKRAKLAAAATIATPLKGGFTGAEKASLLRLRSAISALQFAVGEATDGLYDGSVDNSAKAEIFKHASSAMREMLLTLGFLLHHGPGFVPFDPKYESAPRSEWVRQAWFHLDRAVNFTQSMQSALARALDQAKDPKARGSMSHAREAAIGGNVLPALRAIDRRLAYATPLPDDARGADGKVLQVVPQAVAVHGEFRTAGWALLRATNYLFDSYDEGAVSLTAAGAPDWRPAQLVWRNGMIIAVILADSALILSDVPTRDIPPPPERPQMNPRMVRIVKIVELLTCMTTCGDFNTPARYNEVLHDGAGPWIALAPPGQQPALHALVRRLSDSWRHNDFAVWELLKWNFTGIPDTAPVAGASQGQAPGR